MRGLCTAISTSQHITGPSPALVHSVTVPQVWHSYLFPSSFAMSNPPPSSRGIREKWEPSGIYFFCIGSPQQDIPPSPPVVTMNSEPQFLQEYLFPTSFANSIPLILPFWNIITFGIVSVNLALFSHNLSCPK